jgi:hypothetical protein
MLKTAGGYLLVLQTFDKKGTGSEQCARLMLMAKEKGDWDLCKELARFLMAIDETGDELRKAVEKMGIAAFARSSPSRPTITTSIVAEEEKNVEGNSQLQTPKPNVNGAPKAFALECSAGDDDEDDDDDDNDNEYEGDDDEISPRSSEREEEIGLGIKNISKAARGSQEDSFPRRPLA